MRQTTQQSVIASCLVVALAVVGCQGPEQTTERGEDKALSAVDPKSATKDHRHAIAEKAKDALFTALAGRLTEVMQAAGPVAAINVCSQEAVKIAESVGQEYAVQIGRTSFKLRNPNNAPRDWVKPFVDKRVDTPQQVQLDNGNLGALFPIHLNVKCLMCHGGPGDILDDVKPELAERYPEDQATGFQQGDLRGWFWVEVPEADNKSLQRGD